MRIPSLLLEIPLYHVRGLHEPFSAASHLVGAVVFLVLGVLLFRRAGGDALRRTVLSIYVFSGVLLLTVSGCTTRP